MNNHNPKYDTDYVTLGYLKKTVKEESELNDEKINNIPKNYNAPPNPPYYINSLLVLDGKIYKCIKSRLTGSFNMSDWQVAVATDDINESLKAIYNVNKLEYVEQKDGLIETFYQAIDPSLDWETDLEKDIHVSDLWHNLSDTFQYTKLATNPITYKWVKRSIPSSLFDIIDGHKQIFLKEPLNYKKGDLWFDNETKIAIENSNVFNDEHWEIRDNYVEGFRKEQEEYHTIYILPSITEIDRQMLSEIKKAIDEITLTVSQTYTTKTELNTYIDGVKTDIADEYTTKTDFLAQINVTSQQITEVVSQTEGQNEKIAKVTQTVDDINSKISDIADITTSGESTFATLNLEHVNQSEPIQIKIHPVSEDISYIYPSEVSHPSDILFSKDRILRFTNLITNEIFDYELPKDLLYYDENTYDEFILSYSSETCYINKKLKHTGVNGINALLDEPQIIEYEYPRINLTDGDYKVELLGYKNGYLYVQLMAANMYTSQFTTKVEMNSAISQTKQEIKIEVDKKAGKEETNAKFTVMSENISSKVSKNGVISSINQSSEEVSIDANKVNINGIINLINNGMTTTINGNRITTGSITTSQLASNSITSDKISAGAIKADNISAGVITADKIVDKSITSAKVSDSAITNEKIQDGAVSISKVTSDIITVENISAQSINANQINAVNLSSISSNLGHITGGSISIGGHFTVNTNGGVQFSTDSGGFISTRNVTHPYVSALNMANGYAYGINFVTGTNQDIVGEVKSTICQVRDSGTGANYQLYIKGAEGVEIASNASIYMWNKIDLNAYGNSSVWAKGNNLPAGRVLTDSGNSSSRIVKKNIKEFNDTNYNEAYNLLKNIRLYSYDYKYNLYNNKHQYGFIIDDIEKLDNYSKFFDFRGDVAKPNKDELDFSNYEEYTEKNMPKGCIYVKKYNSDTLDKYLLTVCKAMQEIIEKHDEKIEKLEVLNAK